MTSAGFRFIGIAEVVELQICNPWCFNF